MPNAIRRCLLCGKSITPTFWLCVDCGNELGVEGKPYREWPCWLRALTNGHARARYAERRQLEREHDAPGSSCVVDWLSGGEIL